MKYPKISFITPMKEKDFRVIKMLKSIRSQNYPQDKIEIIIGDDGSNPRVLEEARKYKAIIFRRKSKYAEGKGMGKDECIWRAKGDFIVISESDIEYMTTEWINNMLKPFEKEEDIFGCVPKLFVHPRDSATNRYLSYVGVDPFAAYRSIEGQTSLNEKLRKKLNSRYSVITMDPKNPFCMGSNGFMFKKELIKKVGDYAQDVEFIGRLAKKGYLKFAYVSNAPVWHKNVKSLNYFIKKRIKWTKDYPIKYIEEKKDFNWITGRFHFLKYTATNLLFIPNIAVSIKKSVEYNDFSWLLHAPLTWISTVLNIYVTLNSKKMLNQVFKNL